jgi:hypothetical protein
MLKVSVSGTGSYLGFRGDIADDGAGWVWVEEGCRPGAKKLVAALCSSYPDLVNGNKFSSFTRDFVERFADPNVPLRLPPDPPQAHQRTPPADTREFMRPSVPSASSSKSQEPSTPVAPTGANEPAFLSREWFREFNGEVLGAIVLVLLKYPGADRGAGHRAGKGHGEFASKCSLCAARVVSPARRRLPASSGVCI